MPRSVSRVLMDRIAVASTSLQGVRDVVASPQATGRAFRPSNLIELGGAVFSHHQSTATLQLLREKRSVFQLF